MLVSFSKPHFVDIDSDSDFDLIVGREEGDLVLFENMGNSTHPSSLRSGDLPNH